MRRRRVRPTVTEDDPADSHDLDGAGGADPVVVGDFSDDRLSPTNIGTMQLGENILFATQQGDSAPGGRDRDYITFEVPEGTVLSALFLDGYTTTEVTRQAFMGLQEGSAITVDPETGQPDAGQGNLLAGLVYGDGNINNDLLPDLATGVSGDDRQPEPYTGFDGVLPAGTYTLWLNQGGESTSVTLRAVIETAPPPVLVRGDVVAAFNAGGPALTEGGIDFAAALSGTDGTPFSGGAQFTDNAGGNGLQPVFNGTVYQTEINDGGNDATPGLFSFSSAVGIEPDKLYYIDLYFAEIFASAVGQREFSVFVEGQEVLTDYDILANNNGGDINAPVVVQLATPVSPGANGAIDLSFTATADRAKISAIVIREAVAPLPDGVIGIADAPTLAETGDTGSTTLLFPLTITGPDAIATLTFTVNGVEQSAEVSFVDGAGVLGVDVPNDDVDTGDTGVTVVLTDAPGFTIGTATATGTVTDDDAVIVDPTDIDGDGFPNTLDPSAYDDTNGAANTLAKGGRIEFNFDTQTTDVFDASTGLTGVMVNLAGLNVNATPGDVYGTLTNEATSLINDDGFLQVASSSQDSFSTEAPAPTTPRRTPTRRCSMSAATTRSGSRRG